MITTLGRAAYWLDAWLRQHVGRLYTAVLAWGLVVGISGSLTALGHDVSASGIGLNGKLAVIAAAVLVQSGLLINQLAQLYEHREQRRLRKKARGEPG